MIDKSLKLASILIIVGQVTWAVGSNDEPPKPTETTTECEEGMIWDEELQECVPPQDARLDDATRIEAARELAYAGALEAASAVLDALKDSQTSRALTYRGFIARKMGDFDTADNFYRAALVADPDNHLARAYRGLGLLSQNKRYLAEAELREIQARGGAGTWPESALKTALETGYSQDY